MSNSDTASGVSIYCSKLELINYYSLGCINSLQCFDAVVGCRKGIWHVKNSVVGFWCGYQSGVRCRLAYDPADATATHCLLLQ